MAVFDASTDPGCPADWWDCTYESRRAVDVNAPLESLVDFPLLVALTPSDLVGVEPTGADLRFVDSTGTSLAYEIDTIDSTGAQIWVQVPSLPLGEPTRLMMYWGPETVVPPSESSVWDEGYRAVWHLNEGPGEEVRDSSGNNNVGSHVEGITMSQLSAGVVGTGIDFENSEAWIDVPHSASLDITGDTLTLSGWALFQVDQNDDGGIIVKTDDTDYHYQLGIQEEELANFRVYSEKQSYLTGFSPLQLNRWYYVVGVYDGATSAIYLNGQLDRSFPHTGAIQSSTAPLLIGRRNLPDERFFNGKLDELRVSDVVRSAAWIQAEFLNVTGELVVLGEVESL